MRRRSSWKDLEYGRGHRYAHDEAGGFAAGEPTCPEGAWRRPAFIGATGLEIRIADKLDEFDALDHQKSEWVGKAADPAPLDKGKPRQR